MSNKQPFSGEVEGDKSFFGARQVKGKRGRGAYRKTFSPEQHCRPLSKEKQPFYLHLKECEFRYNHRNDNIYNLVLETIRINPLKLS